MIVNDKLVTLLKVWQDQKYQDGYRAGVEAALEKVKQFSKGQTKEQSASMWRDMGIAMLYDSIQALIPDGTGKNGHSIPGVLRGAGGSGTNEIGISKEGENA